MSNRFARVPAVVPMIMTMLFVVSSSGVVFAQAALQEQVGQQVKPYIDEGIAVGMAVGIYQNKQPHVFGYGSTGAAAGGVPDAKTIYEIGSISKVFTGVLLADAVNRKVVKLDQPVQELLPKGVSMPSTDGAPILLRHLATHTSGLPRMPTNMKPADPENPYADYTQDLMFKFLGQHTPVRAPGKSSEYSNFAAGLLGQLLANRSGQPYPELLQKRIAGPLAMHDTTVALSDSQKLRLAQGHDEAGEPAKNWDFQAMVGAGGIRSTMEDMLKFAQACIEPPQGELGEAIELAWKIQQPALSKGDFALGLGWHVARDGSTRWHNGQTGGYHSMMLVNRELGTAVIVLANTATMEIDRLAGDLMRMTTGASVPPRVFEKVAKVSPEIMQRYVGRYQLAPQFFLTVSVSGDKLLVGATGQPKLQVFPKSETEWAYKAVEATITFKVDADGKCHELDLFQNGAHHVAKRVD